MYKPRVERGMIGSTFVLHNIALYVFCVSFIHVSICTAVVSRAVLEKEIIIITNINNDYGITTVQRVITVVIMREPLTTVVSSEIIYCISMSSRIQYIMIYILRLRILYYYSNGAEPRSFARV